MLTVNVNEVRTELFKERQCHMTAVDEIVIASRAQNLTRNDERSVLRLNGLLVQK